ELGRLQFFKAANDPEPGGFAFQHVAAELQLRYMGACYYDEPLTVRSKLAALGRTSATMEQALCGTEGAPRAIARITVVRAGESGSRPWSDAQRHALEVFEGRSFGAKQPAASSS
ncbi:MAG: acyl-CoA thioesterase, partial [Candidatus Eremiobacteraeota bacterium]|nr:acyl-CoA thioesterase [Candidatus Eremiobacteraeota bacterium]